MRHIYFTVCGALSTHNNQRSKEKDYRGRYFVPIGHIGRRSLEASSKQAQHELWVEIARLRVRVTYVTSYALFLLLLERRWDFTEDLLDRLGYGRSGL